MNIYINPDGKSGGPNVFKQRLINGIKKYSDVAVIDDLSKKFDAELCFIKSKADHNRPIVLRLDGCYYDKPRLSMNASLRHAISKSNMVIFQSNFSKKMCYKFLKIKRCNSCVIYNGIDFDDIYNIPADTTVSPGSFVACSHWRSNKRPMSIINGFLEATTSEHLYMIGDGLKKPVKHNRIHYCGKITWQQSISIMKACDYQIHICHIDSCPNAVVEGLACGLNVLSSNLGGTPEIVKDNGIVLNLDAWDFSPVDDMKFDNIPTYIIADGINKLKQIKTRTMREDLHIKYAVEKYVAACQQACS